MSVPFIRRIRLSEELQERAATTFSQAMYYQQDAVTRYEGAAKQAIKFLDRTLEVATIDTWPALWREAHIVRKDMLQLLGYDGEASEDDEESVMC